MAKKSKKPNKPSKPTQKEIEVEIKILEDYKGRVRPTSAFGDNHMNAITEQIEVLRGNKTSLDFASEEDDVDPDDDAIEVVGYAEDWLDLAGLFRRWSTF